MWLPPPNEPPPYEWLPPNDGEWPNDDDGEWKLDDEWYEPPYEGEGRLPYEGLAMRDECAYAGAAAAACEPS